MFANNEQVMNTITSAQLRANAFLRHLINRLFSVNNLSIASFSVQNFQSKQMPYGLTVLAVFQTAVFTQYQKRKAHAPKISQGGVL